MSGKGLRRDQILKRHWGDFDRAYVEMDSMRDDVKQDEIMQPYYHQFQENLISQTNS